MTTFVLLDETKSATLKPQINSTTLGQMAAALTVQLNRDVASYWGGPHWVRVGDPSKPLEPTEVACTILDDLPQAPGAVAYHDVTGKEVPIVFLAANTCDGVLQGQVSISSAMSHELCETVGDSSINLWADDNAGSEWAHELCDAVESWHYLIDGVSVSDFVLPAFFATGSDGPWNYLATTPGGSAVSSALATAPGGYQIRRTSGGGETQVTGTIAPLRAARKRHWASRTYRRGARV